MSAEAAGRSIAIVGRGTDLDRRLAVLCAESGAALALGTVADTKDQEFAMNSIANEAWSIGAEHFVRQMYAWNSEAAASFAHETGERFGGCDAVVVNSGVWSRAPFEALTEEEWENAVRGTLTVPFMVAQAFGRGMAKRGAGLIVIVALRREGGDIAEQASAGGVRELAKGIEAWGRPEGVRCALVDILEAGDIDAGARTVYEELLRNARR